MMTSTRRAAQVVLGVLVLVLAGCTGGGTTPTATPTATSSSAATPTPDPSASVPTTSPEDEAAAKAEEVLRAYNRVYVQCLADPPNTPITCFDEVAIGTELNTRRNSLSAAQALQTTTSGSIEVVSVEVVKVDLAIDLSVSPPVVPEVVLRVCEDVSQLAIVDEAGQSVVPADRLDRPLVEYAVYNYAYPDPAQWRVGLVTATGSTC
jgi:hypothetical protein